MLRTSSFTGLSTILQSIDVADKDEVGKSGGNRTNLSNSSALTRSIRANYLTFGGVKKGGGNTRKGVKAAKRSDYLTPVAKKTFNYLRHVFIQAPILQHFHPDRHIRIKTDASGYAIGGALSQLTLDDLGQWHPVAYYLQKIIQAKTQYRTYNG